MLPYPVVLALAGVVVGLLPGTPLPRIGGDILLIAFVPGLVFEAALTLDLAELRRRLLPVGLLVTVSFLIMLLTRAIPVYGLLQLAHWRTPPIDRNSVV